MTRRAQFEESSSERGRGASAKWRLADSNSENRRRFAVRFRASLELDLSHSLPAADTQGRRCAAVALPRLPGFHASGCVANDLRRLKIGLRNRRLLVRIQWGVLDLRQFGPSVVPRCNQKGISSLWFSASSFLASWYHTCSHHSPTASIEALADWTVRPFRQVSLV